MKKINLIYWDSNNFGDALNPFLVEELSGLEVQHKNVSLTLKERILLVFKSVIFLTPHLVKPIIFPWQQTVVGIGSILSWAKEGYHIWGAGFMNQLESVSGGEVLAVRGKLTAEKVHKLGFASTDVLGDPALLLPLVLSPIVEKEHQLGIIPHWKEVDYFIENYGGKYHVIDLRTRDIEQVVTEICKCEYILSTSLHGVIVAQAYEIPALWIRKGYIDTDGFKFHDYFSSVDIPCYDGFDDCEENIGEELGWKQLFQNNREKAVINTSLKVIQSNLLSVAPFVIRKKYKEMINTLDNKK